MARQGEQQGSETVEEMDGATIQTETSEQEVARDASHESPVPTSQVSATASALDGCGSVLREGELLKLGGKKKDKWQQVSVRVATGTGLSWSTGSRMRDTAMGSQKNLAPGQIVRAAYYSEIGVEFAFEVTSTAKGGKVYKFAATSDVDRDQWIGALEQVARSFSTGGQTIVVPPPMDSPGDIERRPQQEPDMALELPQPLLPLEATQERETKPPELQEAVEHSEDPEEAQTCAEMIVEEARSWRGCLMACIGITVATNFIGLVIGVPYLWRVAAVLVGLFTVGLCALRLTAIFCITLVDACCE